MTGNRWWTTSSWISRPSVPNISTCTRTFAWQRGRPTKQGSLPKCHLRGMLSCPECLNLPGTAPGKKFTSRGLNDWDTRVVDFLLAVSRNHHWTNGLRLGGASSSEHRCDFQSMEITVSADVRQVRILKMESSKTAFTKNRLCHSGAGERNSQSEKGSNWANSPLL